MREEGPKESPGPRLCHPHPALPCGGLWAPGLALLPASGRCGPAGGDPGGVDGWCGTAGRPTSREVMVLELEASSLRERGNSRPGRKGLGCPETQSQTEAPSRRLRHRTGVLSWGLGRLGQLGGEGRGEAMCLQIAEAQLPGPWGPKCTLQTLPRRRGQEVGIRLHSQSQNLEPAGSEGHTPRV